MSHEDERQERELETKEAQVGDPKKLFYREDSQALVQVAQRGCAVSIPGGFQGLSESSSEQMV